MDIILKLEEIGYCFQLKGASLSFKYFGSGKPETALVKPLLDELKDRKDEAAEYLKNRKWAEVIDFTTEAEKTRAALKKRGVAKIHSETLGEVVYWARDDKAANTVPRGAVVYTLAEIDTLINSKTSSEGLKQIHKAKKVFGGKVGTNGEAT